MYVRKDKLFDSYIKPCGLPFYFSLETGENVGYEEPLDQDKKKHTREEDLFSTIYADVCLIFFFFLSQIYDVWAEVNTKTKI
jgi:hypothetical protein